MRELLLTLILLVTAGSLAAQDLRIPQEPPRPRVEFSVEGGMYRHAQVVQLFCEGAEIFYTTDGSFPSRRSTPYRRPLLVKSTAVVRAVAYHKDQQSPVAAHTYLIGEPPTDIALVSLTTDPALLFDPETGLYVQGPDYTGGINLGSKANFLSHDEITGNCEIFDPTGQTLFRSYCGLRLFGGMSRFFPQKSLTVVTRDRYGKKRIRKQLFEGGPDDLKFIVLRNSGSDFGKTHFRDLLMTGLAAGLDLDMQAGRPAHVYINGHYWGVYNIREKINRYFIADHYPYDKDSIDLMEHRLTLKRGSSVHYRKLLDYLQKHDLSVPANYAYVGSLMDISNFMDLQLAQIYFDNRDAGGNIRYWRPQTPDGKWRWILYDTDWGFGLHDTAAWRFNSLAFHTEPDGPNWPNPPWSTFILRKLLENEEFRREFAARMAGYLNTCFSAEVAEARIDSLYRLYLPEIPRHLQRWRLSETRWHEQVERLRTFARRRPAALREFFRERFSLGPDVPVRISAQGGGSVWVNDHLELQNRSMQGSYFHDLTLSLRAQARPGHRFSHWEGLPGKPSQPELHLSPAETGPLELRAVFTPYIHSREGEVLINEISCYNPETDDWIELYNNSEEPVDISGWVLADPRHEFRIPNFVMAPHSYLIICENAEAFGQAFPRQYHFTGDLDFGINKQAESLWLYSADGAFVDSLTYSIPPTDSIFTLSLKLPTLDNGQIENWEMHYGPGTPNRANPFYYENKIHRRQQAWMRTGAGIGLLLSMIFFLVRRKKVNPS